MEMLKKYGSFINNEFVYGAKVCPCINPANGQSIADLCTGGADTVDAAVTAAKAAFPAFKKTSRVSHANLLRAMGRPSGGTY